MRKYRKSDLQSEKKHSILSGMRQDKMKENRERGRKWDKRAAAAD